MACDVSFWATSIWDTVTLAWPVMLWASGRRPSGRQSLSHGLWCCELPGDVHLGDSHFGMACDVVGFSGCGHAGSSGHLRGGQAPISTPCSVRVRHVIRSDYLCWSGIWRSIIYLAQNLINTSWLPEGHHSWEHEPRYLHICTEYLYVSNKIRVFVTQFCPVAIVSRKIFVKAMCKKEFRVTFCGNRPSQILSGNLWRSRTTRNLLLPGDSVVMVQSYEIRQGAVQPSIPGLQQADQRLRGHGFFLHAGHFPFSHRYLEGACIGFWSFDSSAFYG